jgi:hypothetical protein
LFVLLRGWTVEPKLAGRGGWLEPPKRLGQYVFQAMTPLSHSAATHAGFGFGEGGFELLGATSAVSSTCLVKPVNSPPGPVNSTPCRRAAATSWSATTDRSGIGPSALRAPL